MALHPIFQDIFNSFGFPRGEPLPTHTKDGQKIITGFDYPPIPIRSFDWHAVTENYDGAPDAGWQPVGHGETEAAAIADLLQQIEEHE